MNRPVNLQRRIRLLSWLFITGLVLSGVTAIPLPREVDLLVNGLGLKGESSGLAQWLLRVQDALAQTQSAHPFLFYGTDWLAFAHFVIAIAFLGAVREPVRNRWLFDFGLIACGLVVPFALLVGGWRGIPLWWRLVDCSFGIFGAIPLWFCRRWAAELEQASLV
jgi:hypothetical protein